MACPDCGTETARVHGYHERTAADVPADGRRVLVKVRVRRMRCPVTGCPRQTFREQVPGVLGRYQRRTARLTGQVSAVARELAGRAGARLLPALGILASRHTALRALLRIPLPEAPVPRVLGIDDFALRRGLVYATVLIDAETGRRVDVIPGRTADVAGEWLRGHPGIEVVCRDGSGAYGEAVRQALPGAVQVSDRWHLWHGLSEAARKEVAAHSACWAKAGPVQSGKRAETTLERWQQVHDLLGQGVGLLDCSRRLNLALNTVKRYARADRPERVQRAPQYRPTLVDPHRDHLRKRRAEDPAVPVQQLLREIREHGYQGSSNLLVRYINQGRAEMTALAGLVRSFAALLTPDPANDGKLRQWITDARAADLPYLHSFTRGLDLDIQAATAALTLPHHNGRTEGVNTRTILWNQNCQIGAAWAWRTSTIGRMVALAGRSSCRGVGPAGVGMSASRSSSLSRAALPSSTAACSSSVSGIIARIFCRFSFASRSWALLESFEV